MTSHELRQKYLDFFKSKGHVEIPSASVVPENDPTVLFTTAGMHPLVPYLLGQPHPAGKRLVDYQRCIRTGDIDDVGDNSHLTFFTMLGNWSLGDYFKKESIAWSFEFLTSKEWLGLSLSHLAFTVFKGDDDAEFDKVAYEEWIANGVSPNRIEKLGKEDNWWGPAGRTGPCGPDTEIFYWTGEGDAPSVYEPKDKRWMEIWNNVFMQFNKQEDGTLVPLAAPSVDTGMGLERTIVALQGKANVYETDDFLPVMKKIAEVLGLADLTKPQVHSQRIIADHLRAASMMLMDGVVSSNKDQGYVLRRLIRRAIRHIKKHSDISSKIALPPILEALVLTLSDAYPTIVDRQTFIYEGVLEESAKFEKTLELGLEKIQKLIAQSGDWINKISGQEAFDLYQTFGFPIELTREVLGEKGYDVQMEEFDKAFSEASKKHQELSRAGSEKKFAGGLADHSEESKKLHTATHLLQQALRQVLGSHVEQRGSNITHERLRFDFTQDTKVTPVQLKQVEEIVNDKINQALAVHFEMLTVGEAKARGAIGLFEDKYAKIGDKIKVYFIGQGDQSFSKEICGGPHVENTRELGHFSILKEEAVSSGVRRIKAILG